MAEHAGRIVGWVKWDGDEYHDFIYQTEDPRPSTIEARTREGYLPLYVVSLHQQTASQECCEESLGDVVRTARADCAACEWWVEGPDAGECEKELRRHDRMCHAAVSNESDT